MQPEENEQTRHAVTDVSKCREMANKYGWKLDSYQENGTSILKVDCIFKGKAEFPKSAMDYAQIHHEDE